MTRSVPRLVTTSLPARKWIHVKCAREDNDLIHLIFLFRRNFYTSGWVSIPGNVFARDKVYASRAVERMVILNTAHHSLYRENKMIVLAVS